MSNTMLVRTLVDEIEAYFENSPNDAFVEMNINSVIHRINTIVGKKHQMIRITGTSGNWDDITTNWEDLDTNWENLGRFTNDFTFDTEDNKLVIPPNIDRVEKMWVDDELWYQRSYEVVEAASLSDQIYCQIGNDIFFSGDISGETSVIKMQVETNYPDIANGYLTLEYDFRTTLVSGAISLIASSSKYKDSDLYAVHSRIYEEQMDKMRVQSNSADSPEVINYGAPDSVKDQFRTDDYYLPYLRD